jgi:hypothetical protein
MSTIEVRIASGDDDVEERASGSMALASSDLELVVDGTKVQTVGLRFTGIDIPQGAIITNAYLQFQTDEVTTGAASLVIRGEDTGDAAAFTSASFNVSSRLTTDASVGWTPGAWSTRGEVGLAQRTPDLAAIVQEIVGRSDWAALGDMAFFIKGSGTRTAEAYESGAATAPLLHIEYELPTPVVGNISVDDVAITEGNSGVKTATFTVRRAGGTAAFSVDYATADNASATAGSDYVAIGPTTLSFAEGETAKTVSVTINGDTDRESNETFLVNLGNAVGPGAKIADGMGTGTILDDDTPAVVGAISIDDVSVVEGNSGTTVATFTVSRTGTAAFSVAYATANGSATAPSDYVQIPSGTLTFGAHEMSKTVSVTVNGDTGVETSETFVVNLTNPTNGGTFADAQGQGTITNDDFAPTQPIVRNIWSTTGLGSPYGSPDPSGLAYVPGKGLFLADSEVNESPFNSTTNMFLVQPNSGGPLTRLAPYNLTGFTIEPTGLAYAPSTDPNDPSKDRLYISDDDADRIYWVDPDNPQVKLGEFRTSLSGSTDAEDVAYDLFDGDPNGGDGHLYIANGSYANIREVNTAGTLVRTISLPSAISDPEALLWDDVHDVFFIGGKFSPNIWVLDRNGALLDTITLLANNPRPGGAKAKVTDLELAPSSATGDDPGNLSLYVADYGADNFNDGRLFEIDLGSQFWA